jgi:type VI protein secretion system component VasK
MLKIVLAIVAAGIILWGAYQAFIAMPAAKRGEDESRQAAKRREDESLSAMKARHMHTQQLIDKSWYGSPDERRDAIDQLRREREAREDEEARHPP